MSDEPAPKPKPKRNGRPPWEPTQEQRWLVQVLHAHGFSLEFIATNMRKDGKLVPVSVPTLRKACRLDLTSAREQVKGAMVASLVQQGLKGNVNAIKYWLSCFGGPEWRPVMPIGPGGDDGLGGAAPAGAGTTIIIRGGLPSITYETGSADVQAEPQGTLALGETGTHDGARPNGKGNGHATTDDQD